MVLPGNERSPRGHVTLTGHTDGLTSVAFSPDGKRSPPAVDDRTVKVWDAPPDRRSSPSRGTPVHVNSVAFSPDGNRIASGSWDKTVKVWDAATGRRSSPSRGTRQCQQRGVQPRRQPTRQRQRDKTVKVWDAATGQEILTLKGHTDPVNSVAFSPDGTRSSPAPV